MTIIVGVTFSLFTDSETVRNHLKAGDLEATLTRTYLEYNTLDEVGRLEVQKVEGEFDFSNASTNNVFGVDSSNLLLIPGSYFKADMKIANTGNVAFTYNIGIQLIGKSNALAEQLQVTVTHPDGTTTTKMLSELTQGITIDSGELLKGGAAQNFTVEIRFVDKSTENNEAQDQQAEFDLVVTAVQSTK
jgi:predicted ribosomally synthesized peptide with SipW-like signal peptide